jgi:hypothetical protein
MAELLGAVASGVGVVSFAFQVTESIQKLKAFYSLVRSAPAEILFLLDELETLSLILEDIDRSCQNELFLDPYTKGVVMRSYRLCQSSGQGLGCLVKELEQGINIGKKSGGIKLALKKDMIDDLRQRLESAKSTMLLANQVYNRAIQKEHWETQERDMDHLRSDISQLSGVVLSAHMSVEQHASLKSEKSKMASDMLRTTRGSQEMECLNERGKPNRPKATSQTLRRHLFDTVEILIANRGTSTETSIHLNLPRWFLARRYDLCFKKSRQGWDHSLRSYRVIPYDSPVFHYCMAGDVEGLQKLFTSNQSSPFDMDKDGRTPLHVSLCKGFQTSFTNASLARSAVLATWSMPLVIGKWR